MVRTRPKGKDKTMNKITNTIRELNDRFRKAMPAASEIPGRVMLTQGIQHLTDNEAEPGKHLAGLFKAIREFDAFDEDNDPHHEHDFGAFGFNGAKVFFKIDYYAPDLMHGSQDPTDPKQTIRVLTIMLAEEY